MKAAATTAAVTYIGTAARPLAALAAFTSPTLNSGV
jgi:hypothetical protein